MKNDKKVKFSILVISIILSMTTLLSVQTLAMEIENETGAVEALNSYSNVLIAEEAEETEMHFATDDLGRVYYRIWSVTFGYWKTDWILVG